MGSHFFNENSVDDLVKNVVKGNLKMFIGRFFKNYGLLDVDIGKTFPIILKLGEGALIKTYLLAI